MTAIALSTAPPEDASDLFGYPPPPKRKCPGCGLRAEPYHDSYCWLCVQTGQAARIEGTLAAGAASRLTGGRS